MNALNLVLSSALVLLSCATVPIVKVEEKKPVFNPSKYDENISRKAYTVVRDSFLPYPSNDKSLKNLRNYYQIEFDATDFCQLQSGDLTGEKNLVHYRFKFLESGYGEFGIRLDVSGSKSSIYAMRNVDASINGYRSTAERGFGAKNDVLDLYLRKHPIESKWNLFFSVNQRTAKKFAIAHNLSKISVSPFMTILSGKFDVLTESMPMEALEVTPSSPTCFWRCRDAHIDSWENSTKIALEIRDNNILVTTDKRRVNMPVEFHPNGTLTIRRSGSTASDPLENYMVKFDSWMIDGYLNLYAADRSSFTKCWAPFYKSIDLPAYPMRKFSKVFRVTYPEVRTGEDRPSFTSEQGDSEQSESLDSEVEMIPIESGKFNTVRPLYKGRVENIQPVVKGRPTPFPESGSEGSYMKGTTSTQPLKSKQDDYPQNKFRQSEMESIIIESPDSEVELITIEFPNSKVKTNPPVFKGRPTAPRHQTELELENMIGTSTQPPKSEEDLLSEMEELF